MGLAGRGRNYAPLRGAVEAALARIYGDGWAARAWWATGLGRPVRVLEHAIGIQGWPPGLRSLKIGFISDIHAGPTTDPRLWQQAVAALAARSLDLLLLGGDYVFLDARQAGALAEALGDVPAPLGRLGVWGNHDLWADHETIEVAFARVGVQMLVNANHRLPPPFEHVWICGLDEPWTGAPDAAATFAGADGVRVFLVHAPSGLLALADHPNPRFDLMLCGHTHGGHIALPGGWPVVAPGPLSRKYNADVHETAHPAQGPVIVSRGVGGIELPARAFAPPDVRVLHLGPPERAG